MQNRRTTLIVIVAAMILTAASAGRAEASVLLADPLWADESLVPVALDYGRTAFGSVTEAIAAAQPGDRIVLNPGRYEGAAERFPIVVDKAITICSTGERADTVISGPPLKAVFEVRSAGVEIDGLTVEFKRSGIVVLADGVGIRNNKLLLASPVYRQTSCGVWLAGACEARVIGNEFVQCGLAIAGPPISPSSKGLPVLTGLFEVGERREFFTTHEIADNSVNGKPLVYVANGAGVGVPQNAGQVILAGCRDTALHGLDVVGASIGIELAYCENISVKDVTASSCGLFGLYLCYTDACVVDGVTCDEATHGLDLRAADRNVVRDCTTTRCGQGIFLSWGSDNLVVDCDMRENGVGLFTASGRGNQIAACAISRNEIGVNVKDEQMLLLAENAVSENETTGVRLLNTSCTLCGNTFSGNWVGLIALDSSDVVLLDNEFHGNAQCGLYMKNLNRVRLTMNEFAGNPKTDLEAAGTLTGAIITGNSFDRGMQGVVLTDLVGAIDLGLN